MFKKFLDETIRKIEESGKTEEDVHHVVVYNKTLKLPVCVTWETFRKIAKDVLYDSGYGSEEIFVGCKVIFNDGCWLKRESYDGSEWWSLVVPESLEVDIDPYSSKLSVLEENQWE
jgi:hypothetical protein